MNNMDVNLHIERLVLDGITLSVRERAVLGTTLEVELTRLITTGGLPSSLSGGITVPSLPAATVQMSRDNNPALLGRQVAQTIYGSLAPKNGY